MNSKNFDIKNHQNQCSWPFFNSSSSSQITKLLNVLLVAVSPKERQQKKWEMGIEKVWLNTGKQLRKRDARRARTHTHTHKRERASDF